MEFLPFLLRSSETKANDTRYEIIELFRIGDHEVAWVESTSNIPLDITGQGQEGRVVKGRDLMCGGELTEGVGWIVEEGQRYTLDHGRSCGAKKEVVRLRHEQLQNEYVERFRDTDNPDLKSHIEEIVNDLIARRKNGEFLEAHAGAEFWGGYFYVQTLRAITGTAWKDIWTAVHKMVEEKKIDIEGAVIQEHKSLSPQWDEYIRFELDGLTAVVYLPLHSEMEQRWAYQLIGSDGEFLEPELGPQLLHIPLFGPDVDNVARIEAALAEVFRNARKALPSKNIPALNP